MQRYRTRGFTLIELLVVIAIIAIIASILFPVFARAKKESQKSVCMSNLRQLYNAVVQYAGDYEGDLPAMVLPEYWKEYGPQTRKQYMPFFMHAQLGPYIKDTGICACPAWKAIEKHAPENDPEAVAISPYSWGPNGYSWAVNRPNIGYHNGAFYDPAAPASYGSCVRQLTGLLSPAKYVLLNCNTYNDHAGYGDKEVEKGLVQNLGTLFCHGDGHVELIRFYGGTNMSELNNPQGRMWQLWWNGGYPLGEHAFADGA